MVRNELTTLDKLLEGDRFYKHGDKKKQVMVVLSVRHSKFASTPVLIVIAPPGNNTDSILAKFVKSPAGYKAVFLRHEIDIA